MTVLTYLCVADAIIWVIFFVLLFIDISRYP